MARNRKLNVDEVLEVWDEIPDYTCETDESSEDEYIPSDHDFIHSYFVIIKTIYFCVTP